MSDAEWAVVRVAMPMPAWLEGRGGRPEAHCHREMFDAVRYLVDNGVKWRNLPGDFPFWRAVYDFFRRWRHHGYIREFHQRLRRTERTRRGRVPEPSAGIIDSQSVEDTCEICGSRGDVQVHHVRALADLAHAGWPPSDWARVMLNRRRKTVVACDSCHDRIHAARATG
jgi:transposase